MAFKLLVPAAWFSRQTEAWKGCLHGITMCWWLIVAWCSDVVTVEPVQKDDHEQLILLSILLFFSTVYGSNYILHKFFWASSTVPAKSQIPWTGIFTANFRSTSLAWSVGLPLPDLEVEVGMCNCVACVAQKGTPSRQRLPWEKEPPFDWSPYFNFNDTHPLVTVDRPQSQAKSCGSPSSAKRGIGSLDWMMSV